MATNIKNLRLLNGQDILGEIIKETKDTITLKNPVRVMVVPSQMNPKEPSVGFAPYCEWSEDKEVEINAAHVLARLNPITEFINQYNAVFGGVMVPDSKLIIPGK
jgi:predicted P-loop ATPase/GTPase